MPVEANPLRRVLQSPDATAELARRLAPGLLPGDVIFLEGPIGAGKTHFARALIGARLEAAGRAEDIPSPTFTLVQTYADGAGEIWHADLYRLSGPGEVVELGLSDAFGEAICLVEWPDRLDPGEAPDALRLSFLPLPDAEKRELAVSGGTARLRGLVLDALETPHG
jgi:tRNA threonylcarbamoyl adenosine modification protein YjeE